MAANPVTCRLSPDEDAALKRVARIKGVTPSDYVREALRRTIADENLPSQKETDALYMIHQTGKPAIDLDQVKFRGRPIRQIDRDELERELLKLGLDIQPGAGRDGMAVTYAWWLKELTDGR